LQTVPLQTTGSVAALTDKVARTKATARRKETPPKTPTLVERCCRAGRTDRPRVPSLNEEACWGALTGTPLRASQGNCARRLRAYLKFWMCKRHNPLRDWHTGAARPIVAPVGPTRHPLLRSPLGELGPVLSRSGLDHHSAVLLCLSLARCFENTPARNCPSAGVNER